MIPPPEVNRLVLVHEAGSDVVLRSHVEGMVPGRLSLAYPSDGQTEHELAVGTELRIEWVVGRGVASGVGTVTGVVIGHADYGVPTVTVDLVTEPVVEQRREHARAELVLDIEVWPDAEYVEPVTGVTLDVSAGGLRAALPTPLDQGSVIRFAVDLPEGGRLGGLIRVVEQRDDCVAFEFHEISEADRERVVRAVFASYRSDAAVRRPA